TLKPNLCVTIRGEESQSQISQPLAIRQGGIARFSYRFRQFLRAVEPSRIGLGGCGGHHHTTHKVGMIDRCHARDPAAKSMAHDNGGTTTPPGAEDRGGM